MKKVLSVLFMLFLTIFIVNAQIPQGFNFQAVARDAQGNVLASKSVSVRFGILFGSTLIWQEDHQDIRTSDLGQFSVIIGDESASKTGGTASSFSDIIWGSGNYSLKVSLDAGSGFVSLGSSPIMSVPYALYAESGPKQAWSMLSDTLYTSTAVAIGSSPSGDALLSVQSDDPQVEKPLFEVKNDIGNPVFAVYNDGVIVYVDEEKKGVKGGFAIGGYSSATKGITQEYMRITPDSARIWVPEGNPVKGVKGGFAIGGYNSATKTATNNYLEISSASTNIYFDTTSQLKGVKGGFAIGGYNSATKADPTNNFFVVHPDSTRVYVNNDPTKGVKGGFAIGGYNSANKGDDGNFMTLQKENYFIGHRSGSNITLGLYNSVIGYESGLNITEGNSNAFLGYQAGYMNSTGTGNLFLGYQTGYSNELGNYNTFIGYNAGLKNEGKNNTFMGSFSGQNNVGGNYNAFLGDSTGFSNTIGSSNTFFGTAAGMHNTSGESNVLIGTRAGYTNSYGSMNVFIGHNSGYSNLSGGSNVCIGTDAGYNSISTWNNVLLGTRAGLKNADGQGNVMIGYESGMNNINGHNNIFLGPSAGLFETGSYKLYIGYGDSTLAMVWGDMDTRQMRFNSRVGINTTPTDHTLSIYEYVKDASISLEGVGTETVFSSVNLNSNQWNPDLGYSIQYRKNHNFGIMLRDGDQYLPRFVMDTEGRIGINGGPEMANITVHEDNAPAHMILKGVGNEYDYAMISLFNSLATDTLGFQLSYMTDDALVIAYKDALGSRARMKISNNGNIMLNSWEHATEVLDVQGNARFRSVGAAAGGMDLLITPEGVLTTSTSDARLKEDLQPLANSLEKVLNLDGLTFNWKEDESGHRDAGLIAQDVAKIFPEAVFLNPNDGLYGINYSRFPALFVEAIKEQQEIIDEQKNEIATQKREMDDLKERLARLELIISE